MFFNSMFSKIITIGPADRRSSHYAHHHSPSRPTSGSTRGNYIEETEKGRKVGSNPPTFTGFSSQAIYNDSYLLLFNVVLTSLPVISLGVFEQDVSSEVCLQFPALYQQGSRNLFFDWYRILGWMGNGVYASIVIFALNLGIFHVQSFCYERYEWHERLSIK
ncbi:hypothetical protein IGI04_020493 [Brassica rapa subsp. trilocularis]|uniref:P-type ATPase C-terminal domain-containing protein n=1 Tax=Brassica rapa subsp. trilocularis TaxID=1813537 RepID=A0ABQ7MIV8_BRACM|nr:hypothetical protein IGI04_020493 [Brassica rapa subsp. trilocularis]